MNPTFEFRFEMTRDELESEKKDAGLQPQTVEALPSPDGLGEARFIETVAVIAVITVAALAKMIVEHWLKGREKGTQIDLRTKPPTISSIANIPRGFLVVIDKKGKAKTHKVDYQKSEDLNPLLTKILTMGN
jgi:hypothetical protein